MNLPYFREMIEQDLINGGYYDMPATRDPYFDTSEYRPRSQMRMIQNLRYSNLATFMLHVQDSTRVVKGVVQPQMQGFEIYASLKRSRILTKDGEVIQKRIENWAKRRGFTANLTSDPQMWGHVTEGGSP